MEPVSLSVAAGKIIFTGACLAVGFWVGKKLTNRIDYFIYTHSAEFKEQINKTAASPTENL